MTGQVPSATGRRPVATGPYPVATGRYPVATGCYPVATVGLQMGRPANWAPSLVNAALAPRYRVPRYRVPRECGASPVF